MKNLALVITCLCMRMLLCAQGASCANPINLDPLLNQGPQTFNFSNTMAPSAINCTRGNGNPWSIFYQGQGRVLYFSFTYQGQCISILSSINVTGVLEAVMLSGGCVQEAYEETVCFNDGYGYWAINSPNGGWNYVVGQVYTLRYRLQSGLNGQLTINATTPAVTNSNCPNPVPITTTPTLYNNSCNLPTTSLQPGGVCALSLENTAWYSYTIQGNSNDLLNVAAINCDNYESNTGDWGYQLGIFTGGCGNLQQWGPCFQEEGGSLQWPLSALPVGTTVHIAIDGISGSNCIYYIWVGTEPAPLTVTWGTLVGVAEENHNLIRWSTLTEWNNRYFIIERSNDGRSFYAIDTVAGKGNSGKSAWYEVTDPGPAPVGYYRVKAVDQGGRPQYSPVTRVERKKPVTFQVKAVNPFDKEIRLYIEARQNEQVALELFTIDGRKILLQQPGIQVYRGMNVIDLPMPHLMKGMYLLVLSRKEEKEVVRVVRR